MTSRDRTAVVLFSGGQDSTTCLLWAMDRFGRDNVLPLCFDYGQRHEVELACAARILRCLDLEEATVLPVELLQRLAGDALTEDRVEVTAFSSSEGNRFVSAHRLPPTFVPGRNLMFVAAAGAFAARHDARDLVMGVCETDAAGYRDCPERFVDAAEEVLRAALDETFVVHTPLLFKSKAETFALAERLGSLDLIVRETHTCYRGRRDPSDLHHWGYGCGDCPACAERKHGWTEYILAMKATR